MRAFMTTPLRPESVAAAKARAYTVGEHIAFGSGDYRPGTAEEIGLVFHELVHVAQQGRGAPRLPSLTRSLHRTMPSSRRRVP